MKHKFLILVGIIAIACAFFGLPKWIGWIFGGTYLFNMLDETEEDAAKERA